MKQAKLIATVAASAFAAIATFIVRVTTQPVDKLDEDDLDGSSKRSESDAPDSNGHNRYSGWRTIRGESR